MIILIFILIIIYNNIIIAASCGSILIMEPGGGEEVVYASASNNTTLKCVVRGTKPLWEVNGFRFGDSDSVRVLNNCGIFEDQVMNSSSTLTTILLVFASDINHGTNICCLSRMSENMGSLEECCTTLLCMVS